MDLNENECKQGFSMGDFKMSMFGGKWMCTKEIKLHHTFALIYVESNFNAYMFT